MNLLYYTSAISLELDAARCTGCGRCVDVCPHDVFALVRPSAPADALGAPAHTRRRAEIVRRDHCMECGACARNCASGALTVTAGVGCATAIINGMRRGTEPTCGGGGDEAGGTGCGGGEKGNGCC